MIKLEKITNFIDKSIKNVYDIHFPYNYLGRTVSLEEKKQVIFFGFDFKNITYLDRTEFIRRINLCLDYVRKQCINYSLYYKPHPNETDEYKNYNLKSFEILDKREPAEIYFLKNLKNIHCVFAVVSYAAINAYKAGINSYIFYKIFKDIFDDKTHLHFKLTFNEMHQDAFIDDLNKNLIQYNNVFKAKDDFLLNFFKKILSNPEKQKVWITVNHPRFLLEIVSLVNLIKELNDVRVVNLIVSKHRTWKKIDMKYFEPYFSSIYFFPRHDYSLRRYKNLISLFKTRLQVKKLKISNEDLIINLSPCEFIENMVVSSFKKCKKITLVPSNEHLAYTNIDFLEKNQFSFTRASFIFNKFIEPILGINRTLHLKSKEGSEPFTLVRYQKPLNKIYDHVFFYRAN